MNILYACDDGYAGYTGVSITSLFENNKDLGEINVYIAGYNISNENKEKFENTARKYSRSITIIDATPIENILKNMPLNNSWNTATYYRIFIDQLIPKSVDRILYIDSDTLVVGKLHELEDYVFDDDKACAMTLEPIYNCYLNMIGLDDGSLYYTAGVILYDIANWKRLNCNAKLIHAFYEGHGRYFIADQDIINHTINKNIQVLNPEYNVMTIWCQLGAKNAIRSRKRGTDETNFYSSEKLTHAIENPVILHCINGFLGLPWQKGNKHYFRKEWKYYRNISQWNDMEEIVFNKTLTFYIQIIVDKIVPKFIYARLIEIYRRLDFGKSVKRFYEAEGAE
ncbi:MAG: glycosyltransferase family 8 protein [Oscillospiraceae bacterium]|jgi:lipopolysaccharide biosynthesis glycosyltransferase|nr:glycosyltransferase family 8 protein [Oscillospiraceae bacterium]